jgi:DNA-binding FadR family transcriptional regulator
MTAEDRPVSAVEKAFESIRRQIIDGDLTPGDKLPGIHELCAQIGVSHSSVREAVSMLAALGVLESSRGSGTYVSSLGPAEIMRGLSFTLELLDLDHFLELYELRRIVEAHVTGRCAARADAGVDAELAGLAAAMEAATDPVEIGRLDSRFHAAIYRVGDQPSLTALLHVIRSKSRGFDLFALPEGPRFKAMSDAAHRLIVEAIAARDAQAASTAAAAHVFQTERWLRELAPKLAQHHPAVQDPN